MNKSESIAHLATALSAAQGEMESAKKDADNPFFKSKYADLASVWDACRGPLSRNGLCVIQLPGRDGESYHVDTVLAHKSGEFVSSRLVMKPVKDDPQGLGSAITYARRYGLQAIVGIAPEEDDGESAMARPSSQSSKPKQQERPAKTEAQIEEDQKKALSEMFVAFYNEEAKSLGADVKEYAKLFTTIATQGSATSLSGYDIADLNAIWSQRKTLAVKVSDQYKAK